MTSKQDVWDSWGGSGMSSTPVPAGKYAARLKECGLEYDADGKARTKLTFVIIEGDHNNRYLWLDWPHDPAKFGWVARMMYDACGYTQMPDGDNPEQMLMTMTRLIGDARNQTFRLTTDVRSYQTAAGEQKQSSRIKRVEAFQQQPQQQAAPAGDAPQW